MTPLCRDAAKLVEKLGAEMRVDPGLNPERENLLCHMDGDM